MCDEGKQSLLALRSADCGGCRDLERPLREESESTDSNHALIPGQEGSESTDCSHEFLTESDIDRKNILKNKPSRISCRQLVFQATLVTITMTTFLSQSIFPPFFPRVAEDRGFGASVYGAVMGINCLVAFVVTPLVGRHLATLSARLLLVGGVVLSGSGGLLCGLLDTLPAGVSFVAAAVAFRVTQAIGMASVVVLTFTYTCQQFPGRSSLVFALQRTVTSLAQMLGPTLGGLLYQLDGFYLPCLVFGALHLLNLVPLMCVLPKDAEMTDVKMTRPSHSDALLESDEEDSGEECYAGGKDEDVPLQQASWGKNGLLKNEEDDNLLPVKGRNEKDRVSHGSEKNDVRDKRNRKKQGKVGPFGRLLRIPGVCVAFISFIVCTIGTGFLSVTLEAQVLRRFGLSHSLLGLLFGLRDGASCLSSPVWGLLCDRIPPAGVNVCLVATSLAAAACFAVFGPAPGLPDPPPLALAVAALCVYGAAVAGLAVAGLVAALQEARAAGLPDDTDTHALVTGLWSSLSAVGRFSARLVGGMMVDAVGFPLTCSLVMLLHLGLAVLCVVSLWSCRRPPPAARLTAPDAL